MTQQDDITQRVLTDAEILAIGAMHGRPSVALLPMFRAFEGAVLSKLRSSVAKPWPVEEQPDGTVTPVDPGDMTSAPVAEDDEVQRIRDRGPAYPYTPNTAPPTPLASAPVAGEVQPVAYLHTSNRTLTWPGKLTEVQLNSGVWRPLYDRPAAPQASAAPRQYSHAEVFGPMESAWNAALEQAAAICDSVDNHANPMTARDCADAIRALKQPQADKDGGQQRAGEVDERAAFEAWAYRAGMGPKFRESMFAAWEARAALSATQAGQGERDA